MYRVRRAWRWWGLAVVGVIAAAGHALGSVPSGRPPTSRYRPRPAGPRRCADAGYPWRHRRAAIRNRAARPPHRAVAAQVRPGEDGRGGVDGVFLAAYVSTGPQCRGVPPCPSGCPGADCGDSPVGDRDVSRPLRVGDHAGRRGAIAAAGKRSVMIGVENGYALGTDLSNAAVCRPRRPLYHALPQRAQPDLRLPAIRGKTRRPGGRASRPQPWAAGLSPK